MNLSASVLSKRFSVTFYGKCICACVNKMKSSPWNSTDNFGLEFFSFLLPWLCMQPAILKDLRIL